MRGLLYGLLVLFAVGAAVTAVLGSLGDRSNRYPAPLLAAAVAAALLAWLILPASATGI